MRKDSFFILISSLSITAVIVGGGYFFGHSKSQDSAQHLNTTEIEREVSAVGTSNQSATNANLSNRIIKCTDEKLGEFWTNAASCESADLGNRLSVIESRSLHNNARTAETRPSVLPAKKPIQKKDEQPSLRAVAKSVPSDLSVSCKFAAGRALEIERSLSVSGDPNKSHWRENYCRWINEVRNEECHLARDFFYYGHLCG